MAQLDLASLFRGQKLTTCDGGHLIAVCAWCGQGYANRSGLGSHKLHCKFRPASDPVPAIVATVASSSAGPSSGPAIVAAPIPIVKIDKRSKNTGSAKRLRFAASQKQLAVQKVQRLVDNKLLKVSEACQELGYNRVNQI